MTLGPRCAPTSSSRQARLASALFGHSRAEHQLFGFLQSRVLALELEPPLLLDLLRAVVSRLDGNDGGAGGETLDARSLPVLRKLALTLGSQLRAGALTTGGGVTELHATLLSLLFRGAAARGRRRCCSSPASELGTNRWLWHLLVNAPAESGSLAAAADLEAFVAQLDWSELATLPPKDVDAYVIQPIQRAMRRYDESEQPAAVTLLAVLLAAAARAQPSLTQPALTVLTRSTVRAALAAAPTLALWPGRRWRRRCCGHAGVSCTASRLRGSTTMRCTARPSARPPARPPAGPPAPPPHPPPPPVASQARHPLQCHAQQKEFMRFQLAHPTAAAECYGRHAPLASVNDLVSFPMLSLLRRIALHAAYPESGDGDGRLTTIAARELFALAVMLDATTDAARVFQLEASANLSALCKRLPALVAAVVDEAASRVPQLVGNGGAAARVLALVAALPFADAAVDASLLGTIHELLGLGASSATGGSALGHGGLGGALAALSPASKPDAASAAAAASPAGADSRLLALALDPGERGGGGGADDPTRGLGSPARALRAKIGCAILERVRWEGAPPQIREHGLLLLLACRARAGRRWWWTQLLGPVGAALCTAPLDEDVFTELMAAHAAAPLGAEPLPGALAAVQCMLLVAEAERRRAAAAGSSGANGSGGDDPSRHGGSPLVELGTQFHLWQRMGMLIEVGASERHLEVRDASRRLLEKVLGALALSPHELPSALPSLLASYMGLAAPHVQALRATMLNTLAQANGAKAHVGWLTLWAGALAPLVATHDGAASLYDTLVHAVFGAAALSVGDSPVVPALMGCRLTRRHVVGFVAVKRPWLALAAALALSPQLPMDAPSSEEALEPLAAAHLATKVAADGGSKVAAALGSMVGRRTYGNLSEDKKAVLLDAQTPDATSTSGGGARSCRRRTRHGVEPLGADDAGRWRRRRRWRRCRVLRDGRRRWRRRRAARVDACDIGARQLRA